MKTGKTLGAGTDANVFIVIYGASGRTAIHQLDNQHKNDFEQNKTSEFTVRHILFRTGRTQDIKKSELISEC